MSFSAEIKRIKKWVNGEKASPTKVDIFPTKKCNLNCKFCEFPNTLPEEFKLEIETKKIIQVIEESSELGVETFGIIGGEPFAQPDMIQIMEKIKEAGIDGSITTNGTLLDKEDIRKIVDIKWDLLRVSIDGIEETHDSLRGKKGAFSKVIETLEHFKEIKTSNPAIEINTVLNNQNYNEIPEIIELANQYNIKRIFLLPVIGLNQAASNMKIDNPDQVTDYLKRAERLCKEYNIENNIKEVIEDELYSMSNHTDGLIERHTIPCFVPWYSISINAKGLATPCSQFEEKFGVDIRDNSLEEVWNSEEFHNLRKKIANKELPETCSKCCAPLLEENKRIRREIENEEKLKERYI